MRVLVTRPREDAGALVSALEARGHEALVEAVLSIVPAADIPAPLDLDGVQAVLFTSANGVRAFARLGGERDLPAFTVGEASAAAARAAGFARVKSAAGDVNDLARLVVRELEPAAGALFHGAGVASAGDLKGALEGAGFTLRRVVLYEARPAASISPAVRAALAGGRIDAVTFFSPRSAETFVSLVRAAGLEAACAALDAVCLSAAVAQKARAVSWRTVRIAARPRQDAMLACIDDLAAASGTTLAREPMATQDSMDAKPPKPGAGARDIITAFGGIRPMAAKLGVAVSTVQGWRERGVIPRARHAQILHAAETHGIAIDRDALEASDHPPRGRATPPPPKTPVITIEATAEETTDEDAAPAAPAAEAPAEAPARGLRPVSIVAAAVVLVAAVAIVGAVLLRDVWLPPVGPESSPPGPDAAAAATRIATLEARVAALESAPPPEPPAPGPIPEVEQARADIEALRADLTALSARLDSLALAPPTDGGADAAALSALEARDAQRAQDIAALRARLDALSGLETRLGALADDVARLDERVAAGATPNPAPGAPRVALSLAVLQLRDALRGGAPFEEELRAVRELAVDMPEEERGALMEALAPLEPLAASGVPGLGVLRAEFPALARAAIAAARGGGEGDFLSAILRRLSQLVTVRPLGPVEGTDAKAIVARAEVYLEAGDLAACVRELESLRGPAADAAAPWLSKARMRLRATAALTRLGKISIARS